MTTRPIVHVIDDDESARESLTFLLETADFRVRTYDSGKAFLDTVPGMEAGCVITDVWMPEIGGLEIVRSLKKLKLDIPVIVITGHSDVPLAVEAMKVGAADFIEKPYDGEALLAAVRSALNTRRLDAQRDGERAQIQERLAALSPPRTAGAGGPCRRSPQQDDCARTRNQLAHGRDLPGKRHGQDAGHESLAPGAHGLDRGVNHGGCRAGGRGESSAP
jgi:two-component system, LuxR family, response regulator FixJ